VPTLVEQQRPATIFTDFVESGLNDATANVVKRLVAPDYHDHSLYYPALGRRPLAMVDREHLLAFVEYLDAPDVQLRFALEDVIEEGDKIAYRLLIDGSIALPTGPVSPSPAGPEAGPAYLGRSSGDPLELRVRYLGVGMVTFQDGRLLEHWGIHVVP
jgi:hypothetical protein